MKTELWRPENTLIKVDLDGVLRNWNAALIKQFMEVHPTAHVDYPFKDFNIAPAFPSWADYRKFFMDDWPYPIYRNAAPYAGAVEFMKTLAIRYPNVWLVTTQYPNTMFPTIEWIEEHLPARDVPTVFSKEKGLVGWSKFAQTILIDDAPHNLNDQVKHGGFAICFGQLYNFNHADHHKWWNVLGSTDFSEEIEAARIHLQFTSVLTVLKDFFEGRIVRP
jgi:5'(3')-deoxyribonucleotidase